MSHATRWTDLIKHNREVLKIRKCTEYIVVLKGSDLENCIFFNILSATHCQGSGTETQQNKQKQKQLMIPLGNEGRCGDVELQAHQDVHDNSCPLLKAPGRSMCISISIWTTEQWKKMAWTLLALLKRAQISVQLSIPRMCWSPTNGGPKNSEHVLIFFFLSPS